METSEGKPPQADTTETERNQAEQEEGATDEGAGDGAEEILDDPSHNPDDENLEKYRGG
jgi:hypothetical protein